MKSKWMAWGLALLWALALPVAAQVVMPDDLPPVPADKAQVVFLKPGGGLWAGLNVGLLSLEGDQRRLLGVLQEKSRLVVELEPGEYRFMSYLQGLGHLLEADLEPGRRYFVLARFIYGNGYQLRPIRPGTASDFDAGQPAFAEWLAETRVKPQKPQFARWYARKDRKVAKGQARAQADWDAKSEEEREELRLRPGHAL